MRQNLVLAALGGLCMLAPAGAEEPTDPNIVEAKGIVKTFFASLKGELEQAIADGGLANAVLVCKARAPVIADDIAKQTGWDVGRTSLKLRNPGANSPDAWEAEVLERFEARKAAGEDLQTIAVAETVETDQGPRFRFMKAIPTLEICLSCHGEHIAPEVAEALDQSYPDDQARGFKAGDIRGAFTLSKPL